MYKSAQVIATYVTCPRVMLCDEHFWPGNTFAEQLDNAFADFQNFLRARKIHCSQKRFTPGLATLLQIALCSYSYFRFLSQTCCLTCFGSYGCSVVLFLFAVVKSTQVVKKDGSLLMTAKAFNGRCILEWLHHVLTLIRAQGNYSDPRIPLACLCLTLAALRVLCVCAHKCKIKHMKDDKLSWNRDLIFSEFKANCST